MIFFLKNSLLRKPHVAEFIRADAVENGGVPHTDVVIVNGSSSVVWGPTGEVSEIASPRWWK